MRGGGGGGGAGEIGRKTGGEGGVVFYTRTACVLGFSPSTAGL
jgi:hypothetical protein